MNDSIINSLPALNACLNFCAFCFLISGYIAIKNKQKILHKNLMITTFLISSLFLASYLTYHFNVPSKRFPDLGWIKTAYLVMLFAHIILAVVMVPLILCTFYYAKKEDWPRHKRIAKVTFPIWVYVSVTGVLIYFCLYHWF